jgi:hypothetical protein
MHVSSFADGSSHPSNLALRGQLGPLFERLGVKLVLTSTTRTTSARSHSIWMDTKIPLRAPPAWRLAGPCAHLHANREGAHVPARWRAVADPGYLQLANLYTLADGVTWATVGPAGKLSNKNHNFSKFRDFPPPFWMAFRDDTQHQFARLRVTANALRRGCMGLGQRGATAVMDSSEYRTDGCAGQPCPPPPPPPGTFDLMMSGPATRSNPVRLAGSTAAGNIYVFTCPESGTSRERFFLDDPDVSGTPRKVETNAPWDFAGMNTTTRNANPFDTRSIADGAHTITAAIDKIGGGTAERFHRLRRHRRVPGVGRGMGTPAEEAVMGAGVVPEPAQRALYLSKALAAPRAPLGRRQRSDRLINCSARRAGARGKRVVGGQPPRPEPPPDPPHGSERSTCRRLQARSQCADAAALAPQLQPATRVVPTCSERRIHAAPFAVSRVRTTRGAALMAQEVAHAR